MVLIPAGQFKMGVTSDMRGDAPLHKVRVSAFYLDKTEVTFALYDKFCEATGRRKPEDGGWGRGPQAAINITWEDANAYAVHYGLRLPTEAEWEYADKAGAKTRWWFGDDGAKAGDYAWFGANSGGHPHPVGEKPANPWGLFDMDGNVTEWVADWYGVNYYATSPVKDPQGPPSGSRRCHKGGSWFDEDPSDPAGRGGDDPRDPMQTVGFRCALEVTAR
jgi:formylglycine-generating enzyme required for sulfatase activity